MIIILVLSLTALYRSCKEIGPGFWPGTDTLPVLDISNRTLEDLAMHAVNGGAAVPGVQKKLSLHLSKESVPKLTIVNHPNDYILL